MSGYIGDSKARYKHKKIMVERSQGELEKATGSMFSEMMNLNRSIEWGFTKVSGNSKKDYADWREIMLHIAASPFGSAHRWEKFSKMTPLFGSFCRDSMHKAMIREGTEGVCSAVNKALLDLEIWHQQMNPKRQKVQLVSLDMTHDEVHFKGQPEDMPAWVIWTKKKGGHRPTLGIQAMSVVGRGKPRTLGVAPGATSEADAGLDVLSRVLPLLPIDYPKLCVLADSAYYSTKMINFCSLNDLMYIIEVNVGGSKWLKECRRSTRALHLDEGEGFRIVPPRTGRHGEIIRRGRYLYRLETPKLPRRHANKFAWTNLYCIKLGGKIKVFATNLPQFHRPKPGTVYRWYFSRFNCEQTYRGMREWRIYTRSRDETVRYTYRWWQLFAYTLFEHLQMKYMPEREVVYDGFCWTVIDRRFSIIYRWQMMLMEWARRQGQREMYFFMKYLAPVMRTIALMFTSLSEIKS